MIKSEVRCGSRVVAKPNTIAALFSEGTVGFVAELRDPKNYSGNDSRNLVRWDDGAGILMGFRLDEVELAEEAGDT